MAGGRRAASGNGSASGRATSRHDSGEVIPRLSPDAGPWLYLLALFCLLSLVAFLYLRQTTSVVKMIDEMEDLEQQRRHLNWDNNALRLQIASRQPIARIQQEARAMGLGEAEHIEYVEVQWDEPGSGVDGTWPQHNVPTPQATFVLPSWLRPLVQQFGAWASQDVVSAEQASR
jgi:cell division protein FtsL